jgi:SAM-dependent methyltransferase
VSGDTGRDEHDPALTGAPRRSGHAALTVAAVPSRFARKAFCHTSGSDSASSPAAVFAEAYRVLQPGGRLAIGDIISEQQMKESIVCDADLWASCIGGAAQRDAYREAIESAGLRIEEIRENPYEFISDRARNASKKYGVKSVSLLARK